MIVAIVVGILAGWLVARDVVSNQGGMVGAVVVGVIVGVLVAGIGCCIIVGYRENRKLKAAPQYRHGNVVRDMCCNRCGRPLVLDLNHRVGEVRYSTSGGGKMRILPHTGGETAWDSEVKGVAWCPVCKEGAQVYSLVGEGNYLEMWGHGVYGPMFCGKEVKIQRDS